MSYGWNHCDPNCIPVTVQPPPLSMNTPSTSLCCPDQYACVDPCRPCSHTVCSPMICSPRMYGPSVCAPKACGPTSCGPVSRGPVSRGPISCGPVSCAPVVCGPSFRRSRYNSSYSSYSLPSQKCLPSVQTICDPCTKC